MKASDPNSASHEPDSDSTLPAAPGALRRLDIAALALCFALIFASRLLFIVDQDVFMHIHSGWWMLEQGRIPRSDPFTVLAGDLPWTNHQWLSQIMIALASARPIGGLAALGVLRAGLITLGFFLSWRAMRERRASVGPALAALILGALASWRYSEPRPYIATYLGLAWLVWANAARRARDSRALRWAPLVMLVWANCHSGFVAGLVYLGVVAVGDTVEAMGGGRRKADKALRGSTDRPSRRPSLGGRGAYAVWLILAGSLAAACVNPYGPALLLFPLKITGEPLFKQFISEWNAPTAEYDFWPFYAMTGLLLAMLIARPRSTVLGDWLALGVFLWLAAGSRRHIPLFGCVAMPILADRFEAARAVCHQGRWRLPRWSRGIAPVLPRAGFAALALACGAWGWGIVEGRFVSFGFGVNPKAQPQKALAFLESSGLKPELFHSFNWGGFIIGQAERPWRAFVDGRVDVLGPQRMSQYLNWLCARGDWQAAFLSRGIRTVMLDYDTVAVNGALYDALWKSPDWALVYWDDVALVYARREPQTELAIGRHRFKAANPAQSYARLAADNPEGPARQALLAELDRRLARDPECVRALDLKSHFLGIAGRLEEAGELCRKIVALDPGFAPARFRLGSLAEAGKDYAEARREYRAALRAQPGMEDAWNRLGTIAEREGDLRGALGMYEKAQRVDPAALEPLYNTARVLSQLEWADEALEAWEAYLKKSGSKDAELLRAVGQMYLDAGYPDNARSLYERALEASPDDPESQLAMARYFARQRDKINVSIYLMAAAQLLGPAGRERILNDRAFASTLSIAMLRQQVEAAFDEGTTRTAEAKP